MQDQIYCLLENIYNKIDQYYYLLGKNYQIIENGYKKNRTNLLDSYYNLVYVS